MTVIETRPTSGELRQVRIEQVIETKMTDEQLGEFVDELSSEMLQHIEEGKGESFIVSTAMPMDEVSEEESERLQRVYRSGHGLEEPAQPAPARRRR